MENHKKSAGVRLTQCILWAIPGFLALAFLSSSLIGFFGHGERSLTTRATGPDGNFNTWNDNITTW